MNLFLMAVTADREYMFVDDFNLIMWSMVLLGQKIADGLIKDDVDNLAKDVFHDEVEQDVDDMVKNVVEDVAKDVVHDEVKEDVDDMDKVVVEDVAKDVVRDEVEQDVDDMDKNVVEEAVEEVGDALDVEENQHKWEHWPSPVSSQEMGLQCTKKDWSFFSTLKMKSIKKDWSMVIHF